MFCNVLDNAAKHGGSGKRIDVSVAAENGSMVIRVRDYGPGIPDEELPYVKQKFYKGSSKARGSGIGLAVCDEIMTSAQRHVRHCQRLGRRRGRDHDASDGKINFRTAVAIF